MQKTPVSSHIHPNMKHLMAIGSHLFRSAQHVPFRACDPQLQDPLLLLRQRRKKSRDEI